jgi:hypothetical protein
MNRDDVTGMSQEIHAILTEEGQAEGRSSRVREVLRQYGAGGDWPSVEQLLVRAKTCPSPAEVFATLSYIFCLPLSAEERAHVVGANALFFGVDTKGKVGGTAKPARKPRKGKR